ncbi:tetratricopeptide repeat protein, partial [Striga asiatica]
EVKPYTSFGELIETAEGVRIKGLGPAASIHTRLQFTALAWLSSMTSAALIPAAAHGKSHGGTGVARRWKVTGEVLLSTKRADERSGPATGWLGCLLKIHATISAKRRSPVKGCCSQHESADKGAVMVNRRRRMTGRWFAQI